MPSQVRAELGLSGLWTDITADVWTRDPISFNRGRPDEAATVGPSSCSLTLKNLTGKYSPRNPVSPYYGVLGRNTPLRLGIGVPPAGTSTGGQSGTTINAPSVAAETAGAHFAAWGAIPVGAITVPGGYTAGTEQDGTVSTWRAAHKTVTAGTVAAAAATVSPTATSSSGLSVFVPGASLTISQSSAVGASGAAATLSAVAVTAGDYLVAVTGWSTDQVDRMHGAPLDTSEHLAGWIPAGDSGSSVGPRLRAWVRRVRTTGTVTLTLPGASDGVVDSYLQLWKITGATDYHPRFAGEVSSWPPSWSSSRDVSTPVQGYGILRRLSQGQSPLKSALRRALQAGVGVVAYWPMEEPDGATEFASALGGTAMRFSGVRDAAGKVTGLVPGADATLPCTEPLPTFAAAGATGRVPVYDPGYFVSDDADLGFSVGAIVGFPASGVTTGAQVLSVAIAGDSVMGRITLSYNSTTFWAAQVFDVTGAVHATLDFSLLGPEFNPLGHTWWVRICHFAATQVSVILTRVDGIRDSQVLTEGQGQALTGAGATARVVGVSVGGGAIPLAGPVTVGHVVVANNLYGLWSGYGDPLGFVTTIPRALVAYAGERADDRFRRLCAEEHIDHYTTAATAPTLPTIAPAALMGEQRVASLLDLLRECEATDGGVLYEPVGFLGLAYRTRASKYNQASALTLSYSGGQIVAPFDPVDDDQGVVNDVTVTRPNGSSARATKDTGPLSTLPPPNGVGRYDTSVEANVWYDRDLPDQAGWRLALGTWDDARYPSVAVNLVRSPSLIPAVMGLDVGDRAIVTGLPNWLPPDAPELLTEGITEEWGPNGEWKVTANASPAGPYRVAVLDSASLGRLDTTGSTLAAGVAAGVTSLSVATATGHPLWTTTATRPGDFPFGIKVAGEEMNVTAIVGSSSPQTFTVSRGVNGINKAQSAGAQVRVVKPVVLAL